LVLVLKDSDDIGQMLTENTRPALVVSVDNVGVKKMGLARLECLVGCEGNRLYRESDLLALDDFVRWVHCLLRRVVSVSRGRDLVEV
jgi:hypothetical protein